MLVTNTTNPIPVTNTEIHKYFTHLVEVVEKSIGKIVLLRFIEHCTGLQYELELNNDNDTYKQNQNSTGVSSLSPPKYTKEDSDKKPKTYHNKHSKEYAAHREKPPLT